jgi:hypothetical protein
MAKKSAASPFLALEEEAFHSFREWPIWLVLRARQLNAHIDRDKAPKAAAILPKREVKS